MAVQVNLLNQFLLSIVTDETKEAINKVFLNFNAAPIPVMAEGINNIQWFFNQENKMVGSGAINGVILGIMMARVSEHPKNRENV